MSYCDRCDRNFPHQRALWQHEEDSARHHVCRSCYEDFTTWADLKEHYVQSHYYCQFCNKLFDSEEILEEHDDDVHYPCSFCGTTFNSERGLHNHNRHRHWYCIDCRRVFQSENNLDAHRNSSLHKSKDVHCPGANCGRAFVSSSALVLHFEAGTCPSGLTRDQLNRMVTRMDRNHVITNPARLITGPDGYTPPTVTNWATNRSWNGDAYECFLCHKTFNTLQALNAHLQSPRHQAKIYRCPNPSCGTEFRVLSALTQHVESGRCGVNRFREVQNALDSLTSGIRRLKMGQSR
ncbi:hypothetical protein JB92DRAFT_1478803 [Gautieria morchelliformis]|nr:hypothetical protein JB92DRAFT_1478803 [Gautieria morchelliformis]